MSESQEIQNPELSDINWFDKSEEVQKSEQIPDRGSSGDSYNRILGDLYNETHDGDVNFLNKLSEHVDNKYKNNVNENTEKAKQNRQEVANKIKNAPKTLASSVLGKLSGKNKGQMGNNSNTLGA